jgi:hypothetical protein
MLISSLDVTWIDDSSRVRVRLDKLKVSHLIEMTRHHEFSRLLAHLSEWLKRLQFFGATLEGLIAASKIADERGHTWASGGRQSINPNRQLQYYVYTLSTEIDEG